MMGWWGMSALKLTLPKANSFAPLMVGRRAFPFLGFGLFSGANFAVSFDGV